MKVKCCQIISAQWHVANMLINSVFIAASSADDISKLDKQAVKWNDDH